MTDLIITDAPDAWTNDDRPGTNYGSTPELRFKSGLTRAYVRPSLPNLMGRTVTSATLVAHAARSLSAQTLTIAPVTERWSAGSVKAENQPAVDAGGNIAEVIGSTPVGGVIEWDVTDHIQAVADGTDWWGWRLSTSSSATSQAVYATDSGEPAWELHISLSDTPDQPTDLRPDGGQIGTATPILSWVFADAGIAASGQAQSRVQVDKPTGGADPDEVAPDYDSGWEANVEPEWALAGEHTLVGAGPHFWRVAVRDGDGNETDWSDWAEFTVATKPTLVVDSPVGAFGDPTPAVAAHLSSGTVASWQAHVTGPDRSDIRYRTGVQTGAVSFTVPLKGSDGRRVLNDDVTGWIYVRIYPTGDWATSVGQTAYVDTWIEATWDDDAGVTAPTDLTVVPTASGDPRMVWTFERAELSEEGYIAQVGDVTIARIDADDVVAVGGGVYRWTDSGQVPPLREHALKIRALEAGQRSAAATVPGFSHTVLGVWLIPDDDIDPIQLAGTGIGGFARLDFAAEYTTSTGEKVHIIYGTPGRAGTYEGAVFKGANGWTAETVWAAFDSIEALRVSRNRMAQLVWGSQSASVRVLDPDATSADEILPSNLQHTIRFGFVEVPG